ncbi:MAG: transglutaminase family protein [Candidatus Reddybacter sp.]
MRDQISHSLDSQQNPVTYRASSVLEYGTGYCYAKSHLLVALLRANSIPALNYRPRSATLLSAWPGWCLS